LCRRQGLGLTIVRETVASIGGRAWAEFPEGVGSVFAFSLPSRRRDDIEATNDQSEVAPTEQLQGTVTTIR